MPTTYAHWRFGNQCVDFLPDSLKSIVIKHRELFDYGVHGPDIFFYYNCLFKNELNMYGDKLHYIPFCDTLAQFRTRYINCDDKDAALAYLLGFLCHFTLDSYCHGYIEKKMEVSGVSHNKLESQLDRYLLIKDGYDPVRKSVTFALKPGKQTAHVIYQMFPMFKESQIHRMIFDQKFYLNLLKDRTRFKRKFLSAAMDILHVVSFKDLMITEENLPEAADAVLRLDKLADSALKHYPSLVESLCAFLNGGKKLDPYFSNHFGPKPDYSDIQILSVVEEMHYSIAT